MNAEVFGSLPTPLSIEQLRVGVDTASASTENSDLPVPSLGEALGVSATNEIGLPVPQPFEKIEADKVAGNTPVPMSLEQISPISSTTSAALVPLSLAELQATGSAVTGTELPVPQPLEQIAKIGAGASAAPEPMPLEQLQALGSNASC